MKINTANTEHYNWGENCDGWHLLKSDSLSVIQERMPAGTQEMLHYHHKAQQVFYILSGKAIFESDGKTFEVASMEAFHVLPGVKHKLRNDGPEDLHFIVISEPKSHGDRVNVD